MRINITEKDLTMEDFIKVLESSTNLKDVYLLCHQAGCPVYVLRNIEDKINIMWHPSLDKAKNVISLKVINGIGKLIYNEETLNFCTESELRKNLMSDYTLGVSPYDENYCIWKREGIKC